MRTYYDLSYVENGSSMQLLDMYLPDQAGFETIVWFHGGGLEHGSRKSNVYAQPFVEKGYGFVSVEYRMYPDAKFPDFLEDGAASVAYILNHIKEYGGNGTVYVSGESAGAYMTMMLCMDHRYLEAVGVKQEQIKAYISDSAQQFCHFNVLRELGFDSRLERIDEHAPIYFIREGLKIRPLLMFYYTDDMKCRPEETRLMYATMKNIMPEAYVDIAELPGKHCGKPTDEDGTYIYMDKLCRVIETVEGRHETNSCIVYWKQFLSGSPALSSWNCPQ